jgi:hypothetical protein
VTANGPLDVLLIGSVATDPERRGAGLATQALEAAEAHARSIGAVATFVWADEPSFYCARGYRAVGTEVDVALLPELLPRLTPVEGVREARIEDAYAIHTLYSSQPVRSARRVQETTALLTVPGSCTLVAEREGQVVAYATFGRGEDLGHVVHEWAGETAAVLGLVRRLAEAAIAQDPSRSLFLIAPDLPLEVTQRLCDLGFPASRGVLAMGKLVARERSLELLAESAGVDLERVQQATADLSDRELLGCLLPPRSESEDAIELGRRLGIDPSRLARFAFLWGFDSI